MREGRDVIHAMQVPFTARKRTFKQNYLKDYPLI
jgi:hypothetical protein